MTLAFSLSAIFTSGMEFSELFNRGSTPKVPAKTFFTASMSTRVKTL
jgi:hypothetical protein